MFIWLNGKRVAEEQAVTPVSDRGFLYGDGVFETLRVRKGEPVRWAEHAGRMMRGAEHLKIAVPSGKEELQNQARELIAANKMPEAILRVTLTRGSGGEGYSTKGVGSPTLVMTMRGAPGDSTELAQWRVVVSSVRLPEENPLARFKTCNKLPQILARMEADEKGADEALLWSSTGGVVEASAANLFWVRDGVVGTAPVSSGILPGITRALVLESCRKLGIETREEEITAAELVEAEGAFLTLSTRGVVEVASVDGKEVGRAGVVKRIRDSIFDF